jgi:hypothetical protein
VIVASVVLFGTIPAMEVEIAPLLRTESAFKGRRGLMKNAGPIVPWDQREKASIKVDTDTKLGEIVDKGARSLGLRVKRNRYSHIRVKPSELNNGIYFHSAADSTFASLDVILNTDGSAQWLFDPMEVTVGQLEEARRAGLLIGDPARIYLVLDEPPTGMGNGIDYWLGVVETLPYLKDFLAIQGAASSIIVTIRGFISVAQKARGRWGKAGGTIKRFSQLFAIPRTTKQVADHLGIPEEEVPSTLHFLGIRRSPDGYWRPDNEPEGKELRELVLVTDTVGHWHLTPEERSEILRRIIGFPAGERAKHAEPTINLDLSWRGC